MADSIQLTLEVATPTGLKLRTEAESVAAPSVNGEFSVLPGHLPLLAALQCGLLKYVVGGKSMVAAVGPGFVEAEPDRVEVLTELFERPEDIDAEDTRKELREAEGALAKFGEVHEGAEYAELQRDIDWALAKLAAREEADRP